MTIADALAARLVYEGVVNGQLTALREILDRTEGKGKANDRNRKGSINGHPRIGLWGMAPPV